VSSVDNSKAPAPGHLQSNMAKRRQSMRREAGKGKLDGTVFDGPRRRFAFDSPWLLWQNYLRRRDEQEGPTWRCRII
jgi:hypothetical protein